MKAHELIRAAMGEAATFFRTMADYSLMAEGQALVNMLEKYSPCADPYKAARAHLEAAAESLDVESELAQVLGVLGTMPEFTIAPKGADKRHHYLRYLGAALALDREHGAALLALALRLEARGMIATQSEPDTARATARIKADAIKSIKYDVTDDGLHLTIGHTGGKLGHTFHGAQDGLTKQARLVLLLLETGGRLSMTQVAKSLYSRERAHGALSETFPKTIAALCRDTCKAIGADLVRFHKDGSDGEITLTASEICDLDRRREEQETRFKTIRHWED